VIYTETEERSKR